MAVESPEGLCSPGQGDGADGAHGALLPHRAAPRLSEGAPQASTHQTLKELHWREETCKPRVKKLRLFQNKLCGKG